MLIDKYGRVKTTEQEAFDSLYSKKITTLNSLFFEPETVAAFNKALDINKDSFDKIQELETHKESIELFDEANQCDWFMPNNYCPNLINDLYSMCRTELEKQRIDKELHLFIQHGMFDLLFYLKYLVDTMREHNIVWGVGRGSSVSSYVLYLIGVHKINSILYELDINEFLKEI